MKHKKYLLRNCESLEGKTVIVTGATGSIGREIVMCCFMLGADVIMAVRNTVKGETIRQKILKKFNSVGEKITVAKLDVSDFDSINKFVETLPEKEKYYLINNAGTMSGNQYMTNFLGQIYLTLKLEGRAEKIVFQSSLSYAWKSARTNWDDIQSSKIRRNMKKYARSKRLLTLTAVAMGNPKFCQVHPGVCGTNIFPVRMVRIFGRMIFHGPRTAALSAVVALSKPIPPDCILGPRFFGIWGKPKLHKIQKSIFDEEELEKARENLASEFSKFGMIIQSKQNT